MHAGVSTFDTYGQTTYYLSKDKELWVYKSDNNTFHSHKGLERRAEYEEIAQPQQI